MVVLRREAGVRRMSAMRGRCRTAASRLLVLIAQAAKLMKMMNVLNQVMAIVALISIKRYDVTSFARLYEVI